MDFESYVNELADPAQPLAVSKLVALSNISPEQSARFAEAWREMELRRRQRVLEELTELAEDNVDLNFAAVFLPALADIDPGVRRDAIRGLWEYEGRDFVDKLSHLLKEDGDPGVRAEAAVALGRFVVESEFDNVREEHAQRIDETLRRVVEDEAEIAEVRGRALEALGARSAEWVRELIERNFDDIDRRMRLSAVHAMGRSCDPAWLPQLFDGLKSEDAEMRYEATVACGSIADEDATAYLIPLLKDDDVEVQEAAITALGEIADEYARQALQGLVADGDERVREAALAALAEADFAEDPLGFKLRE